MVTAKRRNVNWSQFWRRIEVTVLNPHRGPFLRHVRNPRFLVAIAGLLLVSTWLSHIWILHHVNLAGEDVFASVKPPLPARHTVVIKLTEADYDDLFGSCVTPDGLEKIIKTLLQFKPGVLAVDVATSARWFRELNVPESSTKIVWARVSRVQNSNAPTFRSTSNWIAGEVLGHRTTEPLYSGVTLFPQDSDWVVRGVQRWVRLKNGTVPTMHWEILRAYCESGSPEACEIIRSAPSLDTGIRTLPNRYEFPPIELRDFMPSGAKSNPAGRETVPGENVLQGKIVILGGAFGDDHPTPFGIQQGADLVGSAVETELDGKSQPFAVRGLIQLLAKLMLAFILAALHHYFRPFYALTGTLLLLCGVVTFTFVAFYYQALQVDFMPFVVGIWIEQLYEGAEHAERITSPHNL